MSSRTIAARKLADVRAEIRARTAELTASVQRAKAAACSIPSPKPIERELIDLLNKTTDPEVLRQLHVALESMKNVWEIARRVEAKGLPWIVVARSALLDMANGYLAAQERGEILSPDQAQVYCLVAQMLRDTEPEWEAFCLFERKQAAARRPLTDRAKLNHRDAEETDADILPRLVELVLRGEVNKTIRHELGISEERLKRIRRRAVREGTLPPHGKGLRGSTRR